MGKKITVGDVCYRDGKPTKKKKDETDAEFKAQYKKTKEEARKALKENVSVTVDADNEEDMLAVIRRLGGISDTPVTTKLPADITSMMAAIAQFTAAYPGTKHVTYDPFSSSAIIIANERSFGKRVFPGYEFGNASIVVNFGADFLGTWVSPVEYSAAWTKTRKVKDFNKPDMSRLIQYESNMSYTGSNADNRMLIRPSEQGTAIVKLYNAVAALAGAASIASGGSLKNAKAEKSFSSVAKDLWANKNKGQSSLVISDSNNISEQIIIFS